MKRKLLSLLLAVLLIRRRLPSPDADRTDAKLCCCTPGVNTSMRQR
jgi:hypothetical protein